MLFLFRVRPEQVLWYGWLLLEQVMEVMSRLIVLVHPRHTGPGFTSTSSALKRRDRRCRAGCASSASEKGVVEIEGVCILRLPRRILVNGLVGFECCLMAASCWTAREGPNSCQLMLFLLLMVLLMLLLLMVFLLLLVLFFCCYS